ncbi:MAG TPA: PSD1 and planctomycete cytochrome C domain-containing protein, partial [Pirellulaceae bacterium]
MAFRWAGRFLALVAVITAGPASSLAADNVDFLRDVKPILAQRCFRCHSSLEQEGNLRLDSVPAILKGGDGGAIVVPGKGSDSRLLAAVERHGDLKMPPEGESLNEKQIAVLRAWIDAGAPAPPPDAVAKPSHWSFQKPVRPAVPQVADPAWSANPIDAFIATKHAELKLAPVGEAPRNLLLRRIYIDLIGLPPTPDQLAETADYEDIVDHLLASPQYGERWGRHWMDVWRYSDWDGYKAEIRESQPHIWRWRDWIVESLNDDKPYDRMVQEMLAADELSPTDNNALRATGYLVRSWYKFNRNKWLDDAIEHTGKAFLGLTFNCCRCHDHMYDPLSQREYYSLRAFFEPYDVRTDRLPGEPDTTKAGLVRVFDGKPEAPTFLFVRGNDKNALTDEPIKPAVPALFGDIPCSVESLQLPQASWQPSSVQFVRDDILAAGQKEIEKAKAAIATAKSKFDEALQKAVNISPSPESRVPSPHPALVDADAQIALAEINLRLAEANLAINELRLLADDAALATPSKASARALAEAAARAERDLSVLQAKKGVLQAEINLTTARRNKKDGDVRSLNVLTAAENGIVAAVKARGDVIEALEKPLGDYTHFAPIYPQTSTGRRLALARWITAPDNPLAARVAINHIWLRHFGTPLAPTVFDFGLNGKPPTNQPLLDWLATELISNGWRMKPIHKLIVTSRTYRLASSTLNLELGTLNSSIDPENLYYWRANPHRMEAEAVRDATLFLAGSLDLTRGGPDIDQTQGLTNPRRSLYFRNA